MLLWGRLSAAHVRQASFCIAEHRQNLLDGGESEERLDNIEGYETKHFFSEAEKAVIHFSEAISRFLPAELMESSLFRVRRSFPPDQVQRLSASVIAVNDWIDAKDRKPIRVLVVEDNLNDRELLNRQLRKTSLAEHVLFLEDPRVALNLFRLPRSADLRKSLIAIMLDVHLPHMSGIELLAGIRSLELWRDCPVIMMTTDTRPENVAACKALNAMAFVAKPVTLQSFAEHIAPFFHQPSSTPFPS